MKVRIHRWPGSCMCPWKSMLIVGSDWAFLPISGIRLDDFRHSMYSPKMAVVQEALMVTETSLSMILLIYGMFLDTPNKIPYMGLALALFVLIFRVAVSGFAPSLETLGLEELYRSSMWAHLAENIVLIVHIVMWALLCEFSIVFDTQAWHRFKSRLAAAKVITKTTGQQKELPSSDTVSVTSSLPSYHSEALPAYSNNPVQLTLPPLYEDPEDSNASSEYDPYLTYPRPAYMAQHRVIWDTFIIISTDQTNDPSPRAY